MYATLLDRDQRRLQVILLNTACFAVTGSQAGDVTGATPCARIVLEEAAEAWINVFNTLTFLPAEENTIRFLWLSEITGAWDTRDKHTQRAR